MNETRVENLFGPKVGSRVTWTHVYSRGRSVAMTTWTGTLVSVEVERGHCSVLRRGVKWRIPVGRIRNADEKNELTDLVMGMDKEN